MGAHTDRHQRPSRVRRPATIRYSPRGALAERFTCRPNARITARSAQATGTARTAQPDVRQHAERQRTCGACAGRPRSTPERACFTTSPDATRTSVASEVKLYLAVHSPSFARLALRGLVASSSSVPRGARSGSGADTPGSHGPMPTNCWKIRTATGLSPLACDRKAA